jgi:uncharacterized protein YqeY
VSVSLRQELREALPAAMKARDKVAVGVLRSTLAAIENAEAIVPADTKAVSIEQSPLGVGAAEAERRVLTSEDVIRIVRDEVASRESAAAGYERAGHADRASALRAEARFLIDFCERRSARPFRP